jgi:hypothetical protein
MDTCLRTVSESTLFESCARKLFSQFLFSWFVSFLANYYRTTVSKQAASLSSHILWQNMAHGEPNLQLAVLHWTVYLVYKGRVVPVHDIKLFGVVEVRLHIFLTPVYLHRGKDTPYQLAWSQNRSGRFVVQKNLLPLLGTEPWLLWHPACSLIIIHGTPAGNRTGNLENQYNETNVVHSLFNLLRIKGLYMFRALLAYPQEALHKRNLVYW